MKSTKAKEVVIAGMLIAMGLILPIAFHALAMGGPAFLPMHIPVLLGGFLLSPPFALMVGSLTPLLSSVLTGMPPFFPGAVQMMFELSAYGVLISCLVKQQRLGVYPVLILAMLGGRITAGVVNYILLTQFMAKAFSLKVFLTGAFVTALPGILIQLTVIPLLVKLLSRAALSQTYGKVGEIDEY